MFCHANHRQPTNCFNLILTLIKKNDNKYGRRPSVAENCLGTHGNVTVYFKFIDYVVTYKSTEYQCQCAEKVPVLWRWAVDESVADMQAGPARYVSVSELYSTDEVELLLDEIRELEPTSCRGEDLQDLEIAGSGCGAGAGGRSPAGTELTERSWDSHAHYSRAPPPRARALAPLYCRLRYLRTLRGAATLLLLACCAGACACAWAGAGLRARVPLAPRVRLLLLAALSSLLLHSVLLLMHVTRLADLLPLDWHKLAVGTSLWSAASLLAGGALTLHAVLAAPEYQPAPHPLAALLLSAAGLGACGAAAALCVAAGGARAWRRGARAPRATDSRAAYRAVPSAPQPCTSRDDPL